MRSTFSPTPLNAALLAAAFFLCAAVPAQAKGGHGGGRGGSSAGRHHHHAVTGSAVRAPAPRTGSSASRCASRDERGNCIGTAPRALAAEPGGANFGSGGFSPP